MNLKYRDILKSLIAIILIITGMVLIVVDARRRVMSERVVVGRVED